MYEEDIPKKVPRGSCYERAVKLLSRRGHSAGELKKKLLEKGYEYHDVKNTLEQLARLRFIDDREFAYEWIYYRAEVCKWGRNRIENELREKRVHVEFIEHAFEKFESGTEERVDVEFDWQAHASELLLSKYGAWPIELDEAIRDAENWEDRQEAMKAMQKATVKRINFLLRRGFTSEQASKALNESKNV